MAYQLYIALDTDNTKRKNEYRIFFDNDPAAFRLL